MGVCVGIYIVLILLFIIRKRKLVPKWLRDGKIRRVLFVVNTIAMLLFVSERFTEDNHLVRNSYGEGSKTQEYQLRVVGEPREESVLLEIGALEYSEDEIQKMFQEAMRKLETVVLGENESRDHIDKELCLTDSLEGYPIRIEWELEPYGVIDVNGGILFKDISEEGTLVNATATLSYGGRKAIYATNFMVYPKKKTEQERWLEEVQKSVAAIEESTRTQETFELPEEVAGKQVEWTKKPDTRGYDILLLGAIICVLLVWQDKEKEREVQKKRQEEMQKDYPDILSKFTLLLETGMTLKAAWKKIVDNYEEEKLFRGKREAYEQMCIAYNEMNGGVSEAESYERFGKRCGVISYVKFGALLSQNLRKGSKGLADILAMESLQAFEVRKSDARRRGEEASTKLLLPMFAMLAVVMVVVIVPAFMSIQI